jgi:hypothetical protein
MHTRNAPKNFYALLLGVAAVAAVVMGKLGKKYAVLRATFPP